MWELSKNKLFHNNNNNKRIRLFLEELKISMNFAHCDVWKEESRNKNDVEEHVGIVHEETISQSGG